MSFFSWTDELDTGIDIIDQQHRKIAEAVNAVYIAHKADDPQQLGKALQELVDTTLLHLRFEEKLMEISDYPKLQEHKLGHDKFERRMSRHMKNFESGRCVARPLISELKLWLTTHIHYDDSDYVPYLRKRLEEKSTVFMPPQQATPVYTKSW